MYKKGNFEVQLEAVGNIHARKEFLEDVFFDIYNKEYYSNEKYFNTDYVWNLEQITKLFIAVTFRDYDGTILDVVYLDKGQSSIDINETPIPERVASVQYEYVFVGWSKSLTDITQSISVYAEYAEYP